MKSGVRFVGLLAGPLVAGLLYLWLPDHYLNQHGQFVELSSAARAAAAAGIWMATWWMTEAISVYATALLPLALFPLTGAATIKATAASYGHEIIFLFLGGFVLALALERCGLHRRFALRVLQVVGTQPTRIIGAFMGIAAFISMWVTNTATTIMLLPIAMSIIDMMGEKADCKSSDFSVCLLLGLAYAASIGGIGTIVGTAPNVFIVSFVQSQMGREISFVKWMMIALPLVLVFLPMTWWLLCRVIFSVSKIRLPDIDALLTRLNAELGPMRREEVMTLIIFVLTAVAWVTRPMLNSLSFGGLHPLAGLTDSGIAVIAALALFVTPVNLPAGRFLMNWETAVKLPWGLLILFGGGLSLAAALDNTGFSQFLGSGAAVLSALPAILVVALVVATMIFLTEMTSNTATTATLIPIFYAVAIGLGINPFLLIIPAGIAASCAFMLPVATPPNAIVFGSGLVSIPQMSRAGLALNLIGIVLITLLTYAVVVPVTRIFG
jgi:sodium-dependent dicarboxylate transporter 2/3/5